MIATHSKRLIASLALVLAGSTSVLAADAQAFADRLQAIAAKTGAPVNFAGAESVGELAVAVALPRPVAPQFVRVLATYSGCCECRGHGVTFVGEVAVLQIVR